MTTHEFGVGVAAVSNGVLLSGVSLAGSQANAGYNPHGSALTAYDAADEWPYRVSAGHPVRSLRQGLSLHVRDSLHRYLLALRRQCPQRRALVGGMAGYVALEYFILQASKLAASGWRRIR